MLAHVGSGPRQVVSVASCFHAGRDIKDFAQAVVTFPEVRDTGQTPPLPVVASSLQFWKGICL